MFRAHRLIAIGMQRSLCNRLPTGAQPLFPMYSIYVIAVEDVVLVVVLADHFELDLVWFALAAVASWINRLVRHCYWQLYSMQH